MAISRILVLMLCFHTALLWHARGEPVESDFTEGFGKLAALGLPPVDPTAVWAKIPIRSPRRELQGVTAKLKGNGWVLPAAADKSLAAVPLGATRSHNPANSKATYPAADLAADVGILIANLRRLSSEEGLDYSDRWIRQGTGEYGTLLVFAAQIHQSGRTQLANQLATTLFQLAPDRKIIVDAAINSIADPLYAEATSLVLKTGDWAAYHRSLDELVTRFPRGWESRPIIAALILPHLEKQAAGEPPATPMLAGTTLDPAALDAISRLSVDAAKDEELLFSPWLLAEGITSNTPVGELAALGLDAIPALAALLDDPYLIGISSSELEQDSYSSYSSDESREERMLSLYRNMLRPATRGEVARALLTATLPIEQSDDFSSNSQPDSAALRETALAFWKENRNASREDLAVAFLESPSDFQRSTAANILAQATDPVLHAKLEAAILNSESLFDQIDTVTTYVRARKTAAKPFIDQFSERIRAEYASADPDLLPWAVREAGSIDVLLKPILAIATGKSPRALARDIARGDPDDAEAGMQELEPLLETLAPKPRLHALLEGAFAAEDVKVRCGFLIATFAIEWDSEDGDEDVEDEESPVHPDRVLSDPEAKVWQKLVSDDRPSGMDNLASFGVTTVGSLAALALESSVLSDFYLNARDTQSITGQAAADFALVRAKARLSGETIPQLPDADKVTAERLEEIISSAAGLPPTTIHPYLRSLSPDEQAAWQNYISDPTEPPLPAELKQLSSTILQFSSETFFQFKNASVGGIDLGFKVTKESLKEKLESLAKDAPAQSRIGIWIGQASFGPGLEIISIQPPAQAPDEDEENAWPSPRSIFKSSFSALAEAPETTVASVHATLRANQENHTATWLHEADGSFRAMDPEAADSLFEAAEANAIDPDAFFRLHIQILSRADAAILNPE